MATYVLIHGAWLGGWSWDRVRPALEGAGHRVFAPTLAGMAERRHLAVPDLGLSVHIREIVELLEHQDVTDVILVGHSYGGMVIAGTAGLVPGRIGRLCYVDGLLPRSGQSAFDLVPLMREHFGRSPPSLPWMASPVDPALFGMDGETDRRWVADRVTPVPRRTVEEPLPAVDDDARESIPSTYVHFAGFPFLEETAEVAGRRGMRVITLDGVGHLAMVTHPEVLARELLALAGPPA
ncbi:alpha/beta fold hydrolase [Planotetraspora kaengkrachanensis]|uniref:Esterase n=1 Tax=Planotetraspora kaengkrachanensis TaxID=575193 RepID=A0A8J3LR14_9ACTN|nr:alpha/beta hydrolase [Planotetraspora kaengkrachanensis]GIG77232.1 esterase [Planotetraspora kaengkrachanensis]